jgi:hypothetical protein
LLIDKSLKLANGTHIHAKVNFGGLEIMHWQPRRYRSAGIVI